MYIAKMSTTPTLAICGSAASSVPTCLFMFFHWLNSLMILKMRKRRKTEATGPIWKSKAYVISSPPVVPSTMTRSNLFQWSHQ